MSNKSPIVAEAADTRRLLKNLQDYSRAVTALTWQRQGIFVVLSILTMWFFPPATAALLFALCMTCEYVDLTLARKTNRIEPGDATATRMVFAAFLGNTVVSAVTISFFAVWVGVTADGTGLFTAMFCLFAGALYSAINNHQIASILAIRLTVYGVAFLVITIHDLWVYRPPLSSDMWLRFFTVIFVMYFLIDCSLRFLGMYRRNLKQLETLEAEHERAKAALVLKSQFVAVVSHELRTPLTSIKGSLDLLNSGRFGTFSSQAQSLLGLAGKNSKRLASLVDDLLDLQKIEEGKMTFEKETIELGAFIADAIGSHLGVAEKYNVTLNLDRDSATPVYVHTDPDRLMQVLGNILSNAAKFSQDQGDVDIGLTVESGRARIFVRDRGVGIPDGSEDAVFGRFIQLDSSDQRQFGGTGLGMAISREIIEAMGGTIDYESTLGKGTTFFIGLPCKTVFDSGPRVETSTSDVDAEDADRPIAASARS